MSAPTRGSVATLFEAWFGGDPTHVIQAPGRVNLIGEHTDYNDGYVLPCAIEYRNWVAARAREDDQVRVLAADYGGQSDSFGTALPLAANPQFEWANYVRGVIELLRRSGHRVRGMDLAITGNVPQGAGLSSSAALEVAVGWACNVLSELDLDAEQIALNGQAAENQFVGVQCGIMDQLISARGEHGRALLIDCRSLECQPVAIPDDTVVVIVESRVKRGLVDSEYNTRRGQCEAACAALGVPALRDVKDVESLAGLDPLVRQRARHVVTENQRTLEAAAALASGDLGKLGVLMAASHASMRDDFQITVPAIDTLVEIAQAAVGDTGGARMTGGGFGGCVVVATRSACLQDLVHAIETEYEPRTGLQPVIHVTRAADGAGVVEPDQSFTGSGRR